MSQTLNSKNYKLYEESIEIQKKLNNNKIQNVAPIKDVYQWMNNYNKEHFCILILDVYYETTLDMMIKTQQLQQQYKAQIISQLLNVLESLQSKECIYFRNIQPKNIMIKINKNNNPNQDQVEIGISGHKCALFIEKQDQNSQILINEQDLLDSDLYLSPVLKQCYNKDLEEVAQKQHNIEKSNVFRSGLIILQVYKGLQEEELRKFKFSTSQNITKEQLDQINFEDKKTQKLLELMLQYDENYRAGFQTCNKFWKNNQQEFENQNDNNNFQEQQQQNNNFKSEYIVKNNNQQIENNNIKLNNCNNNDQQSLIPETQEVEYVEQNNKVDCEIYNNNIMLKDDSQYQKIQINQLLPEQTKKNSNFGKSDVIEKKNSQQNIIIIQNQQEEEEQKGQNMNESSFDKSINVFSEYINSSIKNKNQYSEQWYAKFNEINRYLENEQNQNSAQNDLEVHKNYINQYELQNKNKKIPPQIIAFLVRGQLRKLGCNIVETKEINNFKLSNLTLLPFILGTSESSHRVCKFHNKNNQQQQNLFNSEAEKKQFLENFKQNIQEINQGKNIVIYNEFQNNEIQFDVFDIQGEKTIYNSEIAEEEKFLENKYPSFNITYQIVPTLNQCDFTIDDLDSQYDMKWDKTHIDVDYRGMIQYHNKVVKQRFPYYFAKQSTGYGIQVLKYYGDDKNWIAMDENENAWVVMYLFASSQKFEKYLKEKNLIQFGHDEMCQITNMRISKGIYLTDKIQNVIEYQQSQKEYIQITQNEEFYVFFQCRVNPSSLRQLPNLKFFVVNKGVDVRPYRVIVHKKVQQKKQSSQNVPNKNRFCKIF